MNIVNVKRLLVGMAAMLLLAGCNNAKKQVSDEGESAEVADTTARNTVAVLQNDSLRSDSILRELRKKYEIWGFNEGVSVICGGKCGLIDTARTEYDAEPAFTVQLIVVSGILQWNYEVQILKLENL